MQYQLKDFDNAKIRKLKNNLVFYNKVKAKDEKKKEKVIKKLTAASNQLNQLLEKIKDSKYKDIDNNSQLQEEYFKMEIEQDYLMEDINFYKREVEIFNSREKTILDRIEETNKKIKFYQENKQPVYIYRHYSKAEIDQKVMKAAKVLDIEKLLGRKPREMSGGQRQRIALGRSIVREPKVFLLDEPLSNLDAKLRSVMRSEITKLHNELKTTFIYVTHDQIEAMTMGTRIVVMKDGFIQQIDTPTNLFDYPDNVFVAGFIGTPQMNFFNGKGSVKNNELVFNFTNGETLKFDLSKTRLLKDEWKEFTDKELVLGIRGENLYISDEGLKAKITLMEVLGNGTHIHLQVENIENKVILLLQERTNLKIGDEIRINFANEAIHLFDKETTHTIMQKEKQ